MSKLKFNSDLFTALPSPENDQVAFVFNKENGNIFQIEGVTKDVIFEFLNEAKEEEELKKDFIKSYNMSDEDISNFEDFLSNIKKEKIVI